MNETGIDFDSLACLARCNGLAVKAIRTDEVSLDTFRIRVKELSNNSTTFMALSYSRKALNQTGDGHWSPVGAYEEMTDMVLILDQARFKYNAHWVPLESLYHAMDTIDIATGKKRGFFELSMMDKENGPPLAARPMSMSLNVPLKELQEAIKGLPDQTRDAYDIITKSPDTASAKILQFVGGKLQSLISSQYDFPSKACVCEKPGPKKQRMNDDPVDCSAAELVLELKRTKTFGLLQSSVESHKGNDCIWQTALLLLLDKDFWLKALGQDNKHLLINIVEDIRKEDFPRLATELEVSRAKLAELQVTGL